MDMERYLQHLREEARAAGTVEKYRRDLVAFLDFVGEQEISKQAVTAWKEHLVEAGYAPKTVNSMLAAVHNFLSFAGREDCRVKYLKVQRRLFRDPARELDREEYRRLLAAAESRGQSRLALLIEAICATGIRVSEVAYLTVEAARAGKAEVALKGKISTILLPGKLARKLLKYAQKQKIASGEIFLTRSGKGMSRRQIWAEMKALCKHAGVDPGKVFPHNLRHLFARVFYKACKDIAKLADVLGHSSIETTRIYLISTGAEHSRQLERLGLLS